MFLTKYLSELCDEVPQDHSWNITAIGEEEYDNLQVGQVAKESSVLMRTRLGFIGDLESMKDMSAPKKLLVCAPEHGKQAAGSSNITFHLRHQRR